MTKREYLALLLLGLIGFWYFWHKHDIRKDQINSSAMLAPGVVEKIIVNPQKKQLTLVTPNKTQNLFLPDRPSSINIDKEGNAVVSSPQFGTEHHFFFGLYQADVFRFGMGLDLLYFKKWDFGIGGAGEIGMHTPVLFAQVTYDVYGNARLGLTVDNERHIGVGISLRVF